MDSNDTLREPKQSRSTKMKQKILDTAYDIFCKKGYFNTTTNEIAKDAKVSIGSVYFHFKDKESILLEVLKRYNAYYTEFCNDNIHGIKWDIDDPKAGFIKSMECLVALHRQSIDFNRELQELRQSVPQVAEMVNCHHENFRRKILDFMNLHKEQITAHDIEAATMIVFNIINSTVDQVVFFKNDLDDKRIIHAGAEAVTKYLTE